MHPIKRLRRARGLTQKALGERAGVTLQAVQGWEKGSVPRAEKLPRLAEVLGVEPVDLDEAIAAWNRGERGELMRAA